ncbi:hypothetical protein MMC25_004853 [Agyrium rufum]|nr:hypothetical protein [Agyrium rufum]
METIKKVPAAVGTTMQEGAQSMIQEFKPLKNVCEFLNAFHIYAEEASQGVTRFVEANHYCSHVRKDLRQCLIYDSNKSDARLIGVEYMIPKHVYEKLDPEEQKLWHSHEFEVKSGMLMLPKPANMPQAAWEAAELSAMHEVVGLYGKTWHFWQVDRGDELPLGQPVLMGSLLTNEQSTDLKPAIAARDEEHGIDSKEKAKAREGIQVPEIHESK